MNERRSSGLAAALRRTRARARQLEQQRRVSPAGPDAVNRTAAPTGTADPEAAVSGSGVDQHPWDLTRYRAQLPDVGGRHRVAVLVPADAPEVELQALLASLTEADVLVLRPKGAGGAAAGDEPWSPASTKRAHTKLKAFGPVDMVVDLVPDGTAEPEPWRTLFLHLRAGGWYLKRAHPGPAEPTETIDAQTSTGWPIALLTRSRVLGPNPRGKWTLDDELAASCARFQVDRSFLVLQKRQQHYLKVRDADVDQLLSQRNTADSVRTLATLPGGELTCLGAVHSHTAAVPIANLDLEMSYPEVHLRHYQGRLSLVRNSLLYGDTTVLPASFRYPLTKTLGNPRLSEVTADFSRVPAELAPHVLLEGDFYHLDCWNPGHFGHVITEVVSRLWGWHVAKEQFPELKAIFRRRNPDDLDPMLELNLFTAYGIERADIVWVDEPVVLESVVTATPMWQNVTPYFVHPQITDTWVRLRASLVEQRPDRPRRIFVSRRPTLKNRACRNIAAVEDVFVRHGFLVIFPEALPMAEQATLFGGAEVVAGLAGSGLYNVLYSEHLSTLIVLSQEAYTARYEHLYTMVLGCTTHYFWSTPDVPHPDGGWSEEAYYSSWEFDLDRNLVELEAVLGALG